MSGVAVPKRIRSSTVNGDGRELPDRDHRPDERQRRDDRVDAGAVGQAGVDHRRRLVDAAPDRGDDPVDDPHDVVVVLEDDVRQLELARSLDVDLARAVDHDLRDRLVAQERLQRAEADDLVGDLLEHPDALGAGQGEALLVDDLAEDLLDLAPDLDLVGQVELRVQVLDDPALDPELDVPERLPDRAPGSSGAARRGRRGGRPAPPGAPAARGRDARRRRVPGRRPVERSRSASAVTSHSTPSSRREGPTVTDDSSPCEQDFFGAALRALSSAAAAARSPADRLGQAQDVLGDLGLAVGEEERYAPVEGVHDAPTVADDRVIHLAADRVLHVRDADAEGGVGPVEDEPDLAPARSRAARRPPGRGACS